MAFTTRKTLLAKVRYGDQVSWREFYDTYKPLILLCGHDCGLTADENEDLVQLVMKEFFEKDILGKYDPDKVPEDVVFTYDPSRGRFRHYMRKIIRHHAIRLYHKRGECVSLDDSDSSGEVGEVSVWEGRWDLEWKRHVLKMALQELKGRVQAETYLAFEMYALQGHGVEEVARFLNMSAASVYTARSRCVAILRETAKNLEDV